MIGGIPCPPVPRWPCELISASIPPHHCSARQNWLRDQNACFRLGLSFIILRRLACRTVIRPSLATNFLSDHADSTRTHQYKSFICSMLLLPSDSAKSFPQYLGLGGQVRVVLVQHRRP